MPGMNKVLIVGRMGQDPKSTTFNSGDKSVEFTVATSDTWKDKQTGERKERTQWHNIKCLNQNLCKVIESYGRKGKQVGIVGELQTRTYEKNGEKRYVTEVVITAFKGEFELLGSKDDGDNRGGSGGGGRQDDDRGGGGGGRQNDDRGGGGGQQQDDRGRSQRDLDDEIPF